jgi:hypothetical protein
VPRGPVDVPCSRLAILSVELARAARLFGTAPWVRAALAAEHAARALHAFDGALADLLADDVPDDREVAA